MLKKTLHEFMQEARRLAEKTPVIAARVRRPHEERSFEAYIAIPALWGDEKRIVLLVLTTTGEIVAAVAPPVSTPLCVSRGADDPLEARAVDEALYELGSRYTSWCRVYLPPAYKPRTLEDVLDAMLALGVIDAVTPHTE